jgi:hypothetical protein
MPAAHTEIAIQLKNDVHQRRAVTYWISEIEIAIIHVPPLFQHIRGKTMHSIDYESTSARMRFKWSITDRHNRCRYRGRATANTNYSNLFTDIFIQSTTILTMSRSFRSNILAAHERRYSETSG